MNANSAQDEFDHFVNNNSNNTPHIRTQDQDYTHDHADDHSLSSQDEDNLPYDHKNEKMAAAAVIAPPPSSHHLGAYTIPRTHFEANTGPKGVIADAQNFSRARKTSFRTTFTAFADRLAGGNGRSPSPQRNLVTANNRPRTRSRGSHGSDDARDASDGSEEQFMQNWRAKRMAEMSSRSNEMQQTNSTSYSTSPNGRGQRRKSPSKRRFGKIESVDALGYLDAVEKVARDTVVDVLVGDEESPVSSAVEDALSFLARKHDTTRFVKLSYEEAEMDAAGVPAILAYCNADLIANLTSVIDEIPENRDLSASSLELLLKQRRVL